MKKTFALALIGAMAITMTACFGRGDSETDTSRETETTYGTHESEDRETDTEGTTENQSPAKTMVSRFRELMKGTKEYDAHGLVDELIKDGSLMMEHTASAVQEGILDGFKDVEIRGFREGVMFAPSDKQHASLGYVFTLDDNTDAKDFAKKLEENADRSLDGSDREQEVVTEVSGNHVLFYMAPSSMKK